ncbi:MAG: hypothetical protein H6607_05600 [Flavobacteriales bacterium]|nr:hypothetical protein [Flavobacteriales bacterium]
MKKYSYPIVLLLLSVTIPSNAQKISITVKPDGTMSEPIIEYNVKSDKNMIGYQPGGFLYNPINCDTAIVPKFNITDFDTNYNICIIDSKIFSSDFNYIIFNREKHVKNKRPIGYSLGWPAPNIDGGMAVIINPKQMYLKSGHDNPNPNYLYWLCDIDSTAFGSIEKTLNDSIFYWQKREPNWYGFVGMWLPNYASEFPIPEEWNDSLLNLHQENHYKTAYLNLTRIIDMLNQHLPENQQIAKPTYTEFRENKKIMISDR